MTLIELFAPKGALDAAARDRLGERLVAALISGDGVPADILERGRTHTWVVVHEPAAWIAGGVAVASDAPARYLVRVSVPAGHLNDGMRAELVTRVTRSLAESVPDPERLYHETDAWVHILELPDGSIGTLGQVVSTADIVRMTVDGDYKRHVIGRAHAQATDPHGPATVIDPICGMSVVLDDGALTLDVNGTTYGFCSETCREVFRKRELVSS